MILSPASVVSGVGPVIQGGFASLAVVFIVLALAAYIVGARGIAGVTMRIAYILIVIFIILAIISFFL
ncbi:DUF1328 family protein [Halocatena salina]|uniref:DUF1328 domain-containing protein n=1 Tax=Halocatena salina TaxID=2934340 RepID=A0A8U0A909_9EURY|nr:DUF1328 family protein [Halocatena salina]UPM44377.1 DUF1328 domain-containing protein [Halocatena salina]